MGATHGNLKGNGIVVVQSTENKMKKYFLYASALFAIALVIGIAMQQPALYKPCALATAISLAIGLGSVPSLKGYQYTAWIISAVVAGMIFPEAFKNWGGVNLRDKTLILVIIQLVMFGMGTHMSLKDFSGLASTGKGVAVGLFCHFSIMPLMGDRKSTRLNSSHRP